MKRTFIDSIVTEKALRIVNGYDNSRIFDSLFEAADSDSPDIKNVCAKVAVSLSDQIDNLCSLLDVSKRSFIEAALIDAVQRAHQIIDEEGVNDEFRRYHLTAVDGEEGGKQ